MESRWIVMDFWLPPSRIGYKYESPRRRGYGQQHSQLLLHPGADPFRPLMSCPEQACQRPYDSIPFIDERSDKEKEGCSEEKSRYLRVSARRHKPGREQSDNYDKKTQTDIDYARLFIPCSALSVSDSVQFSRIASNFPDYSRLSRLSIAFSLIVYEFIFKWYIPGL